MALCAAVAFMVLIYLTSPLDAKGTTPAAAVQPATCHKVTPESYNRWIRRLERLDGEEHRNATRRVCKHRRYAKLKLRVRATESACRRNKVTTGASVFGDRKGYRKDSLFDFSDSFAELSHRGTLDYSALGGLPYRAVRWVHHQVGKRWYEARSVKRDIGDGGGAVQSPDGRWYERGFDAHAPLAAKLRIDGLGVVLLTRQPCIGAFD